MTKIRNISRLQHSLKFQSPEENFEMIRSNFLESNLGKIYQSIPWDELVRSFGLKESSKGPECIFSPRGKIALMFLKHYSCCSDERLMEQINGSLHCQIFCDILLSPWQVMGNYKIVSQIRCELARQLDLKSVQKVLATHWRPWLGELSQATVDATCYESEVRYPTNQKLLWECVEWSYGQLRLLCKVLKVKLPRTKYLKWQQRYSSYSRMRRKPAKQRRVLTRGLLNLLDKLNQELNGIERAHCLEMPKKYALRREVIERVYQQQMQLFATGITPKDRIVSISKSYLRPIVRGKEVKPVEFGAKVNKIQVGGISFVEHLSFDAFNEGTRFKSSVWLAQELTGTKLRLMGADGIYATNANRTFARLNNVSTDFCRKGRAGKHEEHRKQMARMITKERASRMEGSFGKEKEHYHLKKVKAKTDETEILWIFFGIHTANALEIGRRMSAARKERAA
jgi:hypothetical protein